MKTLQKPLFPKLENEFLDDILRKLIKQYNIIQIFYNRFSPNELHLFIHVEKIVEARNIQTSSWIKKAKKIYNVCVYVVDSGRLSSQFSLGQPLIECHCQSSYIIYQNAEWRSTLLIKREWNQYKKKFKRFEDKYYHDHDIYYEQIRTLIKEDSSNSVFSLYERLIEYDLEYLEDLYTGNISSSLSLNERIIHLIDYIPEIQRFFVKKNRKEYYLTLLFEKAKKTYEQDDTEMYEAVKITEESLQSLIGERFDLLKNMIKQGSSRKQEIVDVICKDGEPKNEILESAVEKIISFTELEEIYCFHQITYGEITTYYLLLVGFNISNENLRSITQSLKCSFGDHCDFVLIGHDRYWIQQNLYQHQNFFVYIFQRKHLIYSSHSYHPEFHWQNPHEPYHADLYFHYKSVNDAAVQFLTIASNPKENYHGLDNLFALFFLSFCRTYMFVKTFYLPNYLNMEALWKLCIYTDINLGKYEYLLLQFRKDIFSYLDYHMHLHHNITKLKKEDVNRMSLIVEKLMKEIYDLMKESSLLSDFEREEFDKSINMT